MPGLYLKQPQLKAELEKCLQCKTKPCMKACPVSCSPHDFIALAKEGNFAAAAAEILRQNPLGEVCGLICPDEFCMKTCVRANLDYPLKIPAIQAAIMQKAGEVLLPQAAAYNGRKIAVTGLGPAGIGAVYEALRRGFAVDAFEKEDSVGGALRLIPEARLPREVLQREWARISANPLLKTEFGKDITEYAALLKNGYAAVVVANGEQQSRSLGIEGDAYVTDYTEYLKNPDKYVTDGHVIIVGGGKVAVDCALTAAGQGAKHVEMLVRRAICNMRVTELEMRSLINAGIDITTMTRPVRITKEGGAYTLYTVKTYFDGMGKLADEQGTETGRKNIALIIAALGSKRTEDPAEIKGVYYAGDFVTGGSTAVQAIAGGKKAVADIAAALDL